MTTQQPQSGQDPQPSALEEVLASLADPTRRRILDALAERGSGTATSLAADLPVSRQAVVKHLSVLHHVGLIEGGRTGREVRYFVRPDRLGETARWMAALADDWDRRLHMVKRLAQAAPVGQQEVALEGVTDTGAHLTAEPEVDAGAARLSGD